MWTSPGRPGGSTRGPRGRPNTALNQLGAFRSQILAQMGKTISPEVTAVILAMIDRIEASILGS